jgi:hypothetical protein
LLEAFEQVALSCPANGVDIELEFAAWFVERDQCAGFDLLTVFQTPASSCARLRHMTQRT